MRRTESRKYASSFEKKIYKKRKKLSKLESKRCCKGTRGKSISSLLLHLEEAQSLLIRVQNRKRSTFQTKTNFCPTLVNFGAERDLVQQCSWAAASYSKENWMFQLLLSNLYEPGIQRLESHNTTSFDIYSTSSEPATSGEMWTGTSGKQRKRSPTINQLTVIAPIDNTFSRNVIKCNIWQSGRDKELYDVSETYITLSASENGYTERHFSCQLPSAFTIWLPRHYVSVFFGAPITQLFVIVVLRGRQNYSAKTGSYCMKVSSLLPLHSNRIKFSKISSFFRALLPHISLRSSVSR